MAGQVDVFGHYGYTLNTYGTQDGILKEAHHVILGTTCNDWMACTWKCRSHTLCSCIISCTRHAKGWLQMRSLVLLWYKHISWRTTVCSQYLRGLFSPPLKNSFQEVFPPVVVLMWPASPLMLMVLVLHLPPSRLVVLLVKIPATIWLSPAPSTALPTWPTLPGMVVVFLRGSLSGWPSSSLPSALLLFVSSGIKQQPITICGWLFEVVWSSCFSCQWLFPCFMGLLFFEGWWRSVADLSTF